MAEWSNVPDSKSGVGATLPRVRIPPSPPDHLYLCAFRGFFYFYPHFYPHGVIFLSLIFGGGRGIMALTNIEATSLPHLKDFGI